MTTTPLDAIKRAVCAEFSITHSQLMGRSRTYTLTYPRGLAILLAQEYTRRGRRWLGAAFGRDMQTIKSAIHTARKRLATNPDFALAAARVREVLTARNAPATANAALGFGA